jgi:hypothetical protein
MCECDCGMGINNSDMFTVTIAIGVLVYSAKRRFAKRWVSFRYVSRQDKTRVRG